MKAKVNQRKSLYGDGTYRKELPVIHTVGEMLALMQTLPSNLPIGDELGIKPIWFNVGRNDGGCNGEHLEFDDNMDIDDE